MTACSKKLMKIGRTMTLSALKACTAWVAGQKFLLAAGDTLRVDLSLQIDGPEGCVVELLEPRVIRPRRNRRLLLP